MARGICILGMVIVHLIYDLTELYPVLRWEYPPFFLILKGGGSVAFFLISGIAATLGRHLRRGLLVLGCGLLVSVAMDFAGAMPIRFGVLHCLGSCMLLWEVFRKRSSRFLALAGMGLILLGLLFGSVTVSARLLYPLGLTAPDFQSADYFPLLPYFGFFLLGACLGKTRYQDHRGFLPNVDFSAPVSRFFCLCGRYSLLIYLIHQPVLILLIEAALA